MDTQQSDIHEENIQLILRGSNQPVENFMEDVQQTLMLNCPGLEKKEMTDDEEKQFGLFLDSLIKADTGFFQRNDSTETDLENFYVALFNSIDESSMKHVWYGIGEKPASPRVIVRFILSWLDEDGEPLEQLVADMVPYLNTQGKYLVGVLPTFDDATLVWLDKIEPGQKLKREQIRIYSLRWSWMGLKLMIDWRRTGIFSQREEYFNSTKKEACRLYLLMEFIKKIIHEEQLPKILPSQELKQVPVFKQNDDQDKKEKLVDKTDSYQKENDKEEDLQPSPKQLLFSFEDIWALENRGIKPDYEALVQQIFEAQKGKK